MTIHIFLSIFALIGTATSAFAAQDEQAAFAKFPPIVKTLCELEPRETTHANALKYAVLKCNEKINCKVEDIPNILGNRSVTIADAIVSRARQVDLSPQTTIELLRGCLHITNGRPKLVIDPNRSYDLTYEQKQKQDLIKRMPVVLQTVYQDNNLCGSTKHGALYQLAIIAHLYKDHADKAFVISNSYDIDMRPYFNIPGNILSNVTLAISTLAPFLPEESVDGLPDEFVVAVTKQSE